MPAIPQSKLKKCILYLHEKLKSNRRSDHRHATVFLLCLHGLRVSEVINLAKSDLRPKLKSIFVRTLKGGENRQVPIDPITWQALQREAEWSGDRIATAIVNYNLLALDSRNLRRVWGNWRRRFACGSYRIHDLRHTAARVVYVKSEHDPFASKQILGHRRIETTFGYLSGGSTAKELRLFLPTYATMEASEMDTMQDTQKKVSRLINIVEQLTEKIERLEKDARSKRRRSSGSAKPNAEA
jgi:integrase